MNDSDISATIEVPDVFEERCTFMIEIGPKKQASLMHGVGFDYGLYSAIARIVKTGDIPDNISDHFICGMPRAGHFDFRQVDRANAELEFHRLSRPGMVPVLRESSGAYVALAAVPMRISPHLSVEFNRKDLRAEQISFDYERQPSHNVRFLIHDKGGRNKRDDLRVHINSIELSAEC